ncbi:MAG: hypothetical protein ACI8RD_006775 [Bacillariaceae sp.]|jgi:hypothetical protein
MPSTKNLEEIIMDDSKFLGWSSRDNLSNLENHRDKFIFHDCSKALERVSIRRAKCHFLENNNIDVVVPQNVLIKFVRNVPSLRWFRSDLTQDNITMLRLERPEIELLN